MFYKIMVVKDKETGGILYVYIPQLAEQVAIEEQEDYGLYCILHDTNIDGYDIPQNLKFDAAREWVRRFPNGIPDQSSDWMFMAQLAATRLTAR